MVDRKPGEGFPEERDREDSGKNPNRPSSSLSSETPPRPKLDKGKGRARDESEGEESSPADLEESDFGGLNLSAQEIIEQRQALELFQEQKAAELQCRNARNAYERQKKHQDEDSLEALRLQDEEEDLTKALHESMIDEYDRRKQPFSSNTGSPCTHKKYPQSHNASLDDHNRPLEPITEGSEELGDDYQGEENILPIQQGMPTANPPPTQISPSLATRPLASSPPATPSRLRRPDQQRYTHPHRRHRSDGH